MPKSEGHANLVAAHPGNQQRREARSQEPHPRPRRFDKRAAEIEEELFALPHVTPLDAPALREIAKLMSLIERVDHALADGRVEGRGMVARKLIEHRVASAASFAMAPGTRRYAEVESDLGGGARPRRSRRGDPPPDARAHQNGDDVNAEARASSRRSPSATTPRSDPPTGSRPSSYSKTTSAGDGDAVPEGGAGDPADQLDDELDSSSPARSQARGAALPEARRALREEVERRAREITDAERDRGRVERRAAELYVSAPVRSPSGPGRSRRSPTARTPADGTEPMGPPRQASEDPPGIAVVTLKRQWPSGRPARRRIFGG